MFVAITVAGRAEEIREKERWSRHAALTLLVFASALFASIALSIPEQSPVALGYEIIAVAAGTGAVTFWLIGAQEDDGPFVRFAGPVPVVVVGKVVRRYWHALDVAGNANTEYRTAVTQALALGAAGILLVVKIHSGLYVLVGAIALILALGFWAAWRLAIGVEPKDYKPDPAGASSNMDECAVVSRPSSAIRTTSRRDG